jgi:hypothetical protein
MFEGKELEQKLGDKGSLSVDVSDKGMVEVKLAYADGGLKAGSFVELDIISVLEVLVSKTGNEVDDALVASVKAALGR